MLRRLTTLEGYTVDGLDGDVGSVVDFLLDDKRWIVRYLVVETSQGTSRFGRRVLVSPVAFRQARSSTNRLYVAQPVDKIINCPVIDFDKPITRRQEREHHRYYGYPCYWAATSADDTSAEVHLHSVAEIRGYVVHGTDKVVGHVGDFIVDDEAAEIRYLVVDTRNWWLGREVLVAPSWARHIDWKRRDLRTGLSRQSIKDGPEWDASGAEGGPARASRRPAGP